MAGLMAVARPAAISGPTTKTSSSWIASKAYALWSVSSGTSRPHSERMEAEIGGMLAPWSAASATSSQTGASERIASVSAQRNSVVPAPVTRITRLRPLRSTSLPTKPAVRPTASDSAPTTAPICPYWYPSSRIRRRIDRGTIANGRRPIAANTATRATPGARSTSR